MDSFVESSMEGAITGIIRNLEGTLVDAHTIISQCLDLSSSFSQLRITHCHHETNSIAEGLHFFPSPNLVGFTL
ncbi:hypothetical protein EUGRSUZ_C00314 [Eucalyptus grandis]|uniref:Uncharacterized protein n=2 Tax=Eucalyptus grandis TaxID=71139 RepID=A0A059CKF1_EUCGR|nr:hypothetical protein EUGRSUZ_C00314 [Eucalyptus grandis]